VPLPFEELKKRLRSQFDSNLKILDDQLDAMVEQSSVEYLFTLNGVDEVITKATDIIADKTEAIAGIFETDNVNRSPFIWTRNHWFVIANRDSLRHDFYHYFLDKLYERGESLSARDKQIYAFIKADD
jgi:hypothetical protein